MCGVIVVDAESFGLLDTDVMPIFMIIALDIFIIMRFSINCPTVICLPTVGDITIRYDPPKRGRIIPMTTHHNEAHDHMAVCR